MKGRIDFAERALRERLAQVADANAGVIRQAVALGQPLRDVLVPMQAAWMAAAWMQLAETLTICDPALAAKTPGERAAIERYRDKLRHALETALVPARAIVESVERGAR